MCTATGEAPREWDIVVFGATGDVGTAIATYVANTIHTYNKKDGEVKWAIAGRSEASLNRLRSRIIANRTKPNLSDDIGLLTADLSSPDDLTTLAKSTRVLITAVGPYAFLGERVYEACIEQGTHYVDITAEAHWVDAMRKKYQKRANETGATLCSFAGYDCVPSDITTLLARKALSECDGNDAMLEGLEVVTRISQMVIPRGTIRTTLAMIVKECTTFMSSLVRFASGNGSFHWKSALALVRWLLPKWSSNIGCFTFPHYMGFANIPVIYKSHGASLDCIFHDRMALQNSEDSMWTGYGLLQTSVFYFWCLVFTPWYLLVVMIAIVMPSFVGDLLLRLFDSFQYRGHTGTNQKELEAISTELWNYATSSKGSKATVHMYVQGDPGIACTALLAVETTYSMLGLLDQNKLPKGVIGSRSEIVGEALIHRLQDEETIGHLCTLTVTVTKQDSNKKDD